MLCAFAQRMDGWGCRMKDEERRFPVFEQIMSVVEPHRRREMGHDERRGSKLQRSFS